MAVQARSIIPSLNHLLSEAHARQIPVVFALDSFLEGDFIFGGKMKPHAIRGTEGAELIDELDRRPGDIILPKRRFSAFFKTDLDQTLRLLGVDTVVVSGIATQFCIIATAFDALCHDFRAIVVEDCCAAPTPRIHEAILGCYRRNPLWPLFRIMDTETLVSELDA